MPENGRLRVSCADEQHFRRALRDPRSPCYALDLSARRESRDAADFDETVAIYEKRAIGLLFVVQ